MQTILGEVLQVQVFYGKLQYDHSQQILFIPESKIIPIFLHLFPDQPGRIPEHMFLRLTLYTQTVWPLCNNY